MKLLLALFLGLHGAIHLLGAAKGFRLAALPQLTRPISPVGAGLWLAAGTLFMTAAGLLFVWPRNWWIAAAVALPLSMLAISSSWADAKVGALANLLVLVTVAYGFQVSGPFSLRTAYDHDVASGLARLAPDQPIAESDLMAVPPPVQRFIRASGAVGRPRVTNFRARMHGRIRSGPRDPWMPFTAEQHNFFDEVSRFFYMDASRGLVPFQVFHRYAGSAASMQVKVAGLVTVQASSGDAMTRAETVTLLNDMCLLAPATLLSPAVTWEMVDELSVRAGFTNAGQPIRADLVFNAVGDLVDFRSDDRGRASTDGRTLENLPWSTPLGAFRSSGGRRLPAGGEARWHDATGEYAYIEMEIDEVNYNLRGSTLIR